jgi:hypothetical protein
MRATHLLAVVGSTPDLQQFAREALWVAQERDLPLTIAVRIQPHLQCQALGLETIDDLAGFAERWNVTLLPWRSRADLEAMIGGWAAAEGDPAHADRGEQQRGPIETDAHQRAGSGLAAVQIEQHRADHRQIGQVLQVQH